MATKSMIPADEIKPSRSELKRQAKHAETLAQELTALSANDIAKLPLDKLLKEEILAAQGLKGGSKKRLTKYIAKELRNMNTEPVLLHLEERKGSKLKKNQEFHELERLRDAIINETLSAFEFARDNNDPLPPNWTSPSLSAAGENLPGIDSTAIQSSANQFARTRKPAQSRQIFRLLQAALEKKKYGL